MRSRDLLRHVLLLATLSATTGAYAHEPNPLPDETCRCWTGTSEGNDRVAMTVYLCREDKVVTGTFDWRGSQSGHSVRDLEGKVTRKGLKLHDVAMPVDEPNPPWRFCLIDEYDLDWGAHAELHGSYRSRACFDVAEIELLPTKRDVCDPEGGVS